MWSPDSTKVKKIAVTIIKRACFVQFSYIPLLCSLLENISKVRYKLENQVYLFSNSDMTKIHLPVDNAEQTIETQNNKS